MRVASVLCVLLAGCGSPAPNDPAEAKRSVAAARAEAARLKRACGSQDGYERLKAAAFADAGRVRRGESPALKRLASLSVVRVDQPVAVGRDAGLGVTVCRGRLILELPPGAEDAFDGDRRLEADVEYAAQEAADGSGLVYRMKGAEPIVYRLAAVDLRAREAEMAAVAMPAPRPAPEPSPTTAARAAPARPKPKAAARVAPQPKPRATAAARVAPRKVKPTPKPRAVAVARVSPKPKPKPKPKPRATAVIRAEPVKVRPTPRPIRVAVRAAARPAPRASARPSYACGGVRSRVERLVCGDAGLARADRAMSAEFRAALAEGDPYARRELRASRDRFLRYRDRCGSAACVAQAYADRIDEIRDIAGGE